MSYILACKIGPFNYFLRIKWKGGKPIFSYEGLRDNATKMDHSEAKTALSLIDNKSPLYFEIITLNQ